MDAPLGIIFLRKAELYNLVIRLDKQSAIDKKNADKVKGTEKEKKHNKAPNTWAVERNIFEWSYEGHKHLGTPLIPEFFRNSNQKLTDWQLTYENGNIKEEYEDILQQPEKILENMVIKGFSDFYNNLDHSKGVVINKDGLLLGEVIYKIREKNSHVIYQVYSWLMDCGGAWILLIIFIITIITVVMTWIINFINLFCR
jgi:hypothetical protein